MNRFSRAELLLGKEAVQRLNDARVAVFGIGGVGSYVAEALARGGIGGFALIDGDKVAVSNINRQLIATDKTIGQYKADVMCARIRDINSKATVSVFNCFYGSENADTFDFGEYSYIVDAIDMVSSKLLLAEKAKAASVPIISSMGTGNKLNPTLFEVSDIYKTSVCPLARVMRKELKARGIDSLKVVYSKEQPQIPVRDSDTDYEDTKRQTPGSVSFVPSAAGLIIAGEVIMDLIKKD